MTRETRIGLLVGLVFIVAFGLVLSELTGKTSPPAQQGSTTEDFTRGGWVSAIQDTPVPLPEIGSDSRPAVRSENDALAMGNVRTPDDPVIRASWQIPDDPVPVNPVPVDDRRVAGIDAPPPMGDTPRPTGTTVPRDIAMRDVPPAGMTVYTVEAGDNLSKIARKVYGAGHEKDYKVIFQANKAILASESAGLKIGQKLNIPVASSGTPSTPAPVAGGRTPAPATPAPSSPATAGRPTTPGTAGTREVDLGEMARMFKPTPSAPSSPTPVETGTTAPAPAASTPDLPSGAKLYVVQQGDSLSKIARKTYNNDSKASVDKIFKANRDRMASVNDLQVGEKLVIPG